MKTKASTPATVAFTFLYVWISVSVVAVVGALLLLFDYFVNRISMGAFADILYGVFSASFVCMVSLAQKRIAEAKRPFLVSLIVSGIYLAMIIVPFVAKSFLVIIRYGFDGNALLGLLYEQGIFVLLPLAVAVFLVGCAAFLDCHWQKLGAIKGSWQRQAASLTLGVFMGAFGVLTIVLCASQGLASLLNAGLFIGGLYVLCYWYRVAKSFAPNRWLASLVTLGILLGSVLILRLHLWDLNEMTEIMLIGAIVGLLLYDLGCFVAERIRKKLATKKQGSLEETTEA